MARCNPAAVLDLVEEALDQIPSSIEIRAEAPDRIVAIGAWWNVGSGAFRGSDLSDPVGIVAAVGEQHRSALSGEAVVVRLTSRQREPNRKAIGIDQHMNLAGQSTAPTPHRLSPSSCDARPMLRQSQSVEPDCRAVIQAPDHEGAEFMRCELCDDEWTAIKPMLPNKPRGVPRVNDRRVRRVWSRSAQKRTHYADFEFCRV